MNTTASLAEPSDNNGVVSNGFHRLTGIECKQLYEMKLLDAPAYILLIIKCHGKAGWKWTFTVKDFCKTWGLHERTFYRAVSKLKQLNLLHWETKDTITVWHGTDIASEHDTDDSDTRDMSTNTLTPMTSDMTSVTVSMTPMTVNVTSVSQETAESLVIKEVENTPDYIQTSSYSSEYGEEKPPTVAPLRGAPTAMEEELNGPAILLATLEKVAEKRKSGTRSHFQEKKPVKPSQRRVLTEYELEVARIQDEQRR